MINKKIIFIAIGLIIVAGLIFGLYSGKEIKKEILNFDECVSAGNIILETYPAQCKDSKGNIFIEDIKRDENKIEIIERIKSDSLGLSGKKGILINSEEEWKEFFIKDSGIDFEKQSVIAVFAGQRMTGGYSVEIMDILETSEDFLKIVVKEKKPGRNCFVTQAITHPYDAVLIQKISKTLIELDYREEIYDC